MPKNVIFCADGTWNGPSDQSGESVLDSDDISGELQTNSITNVVKLYANLAGQVTPQTARLKDEQEKVRLDTTGATTQVAKYLHGVGDSNNLATKLIGGMFGAGVIVRIVRGFTFISRNYEPGDAIYLVGFSRGAYTARALAGMISRVGLLNPRVVDLSDKEAAYRAVMAAWYRSHSIAVAKTPIGGLSDLLTHLVNYCESWLGHRLPADALLPDIPIKSVAVWDTVGSYGIPEYAKDKRVDLFRFCDLSLSPCVEYGFHAMAIDEMREDFPVTRWEPRENILETWFIGAHADVGGGYPEAESRLSDIGCDWLTEQLQGVGVQFSKPAVYVPDGDQKQAIHKPWESPPFDLLGKASRAVKASDSLHPTVKSRLSSDPSYRPQALSAWLEARAGPG